MAGPPSPEEPCEPLPATVVMVPLEETLRMRLLLADGMSSVQGLSTATPLGPASWALMAGPPSPEEPCEPLPATVVMIPSEETLRMRLLLASAMKRFEAPSTATRLGPASWALMAGPPSPEKPCEPLPATVVMIPLAETFRMRLLLASAMKRFPAPSTAAPKVRFPSDALPI